MAVHLKVKLDPWDDPAFVAAYEAAAARLAEKGLEPESASGQRELQRDLRSHGFTTATVYCERTVEDVLAHRASCVVSRDGAAPAPLGGGPAH